MKVCPKCDLSKSLDEFNVNSKRSDGRQSVCRDCQSSYYRDNQVQHKANVRARKIVYKPKMLRVIGDAFSAGCVDCGNDDIRVLEFDHLPEHEKKYDISRIVAGSLSMQTLLDEIAKCEVRCRNCHIIKTYERSGSSDWRSTWGSTGQSF